MEEITEEKLGVTELSGRSKRGTKRDLFPAGYILVTFENCGTEGKASTN